MPSKLPQRICITPQARSVGGPASFQRRFAAGLAARGIQATFDLDDAPYDAVLVVGATRRLGKLRRVKKAGIPIVQRLNGINWLHKKRKTGLRHYLKAEYGNFLLSYVRHHLANRIIYQSEFARDWWQRAFGAVAAPGTIAYNAVDLEVFSPSQAGRPPADIYRLLLVEGRLGGGYEMGLEAAVAMAEELRRVHDLPVELVIAGKVDAQVISDWEGRTGIPLTWAGLLPSAEIPALDGSAHLLYSADLNAACPNSVIEALACGLPVVAFATGALPELVKDGAGEVVPYGGDPWALDRPDIPALAAAAARILHSQTAYRQAARARAEAAFGLDAMLDAYLAALSS